MSTNTDKSSAPVAPVTVLDRTRINSLGQIKLVSDPPESGSGRSTSASVIKDGPQTFWRKTKKIISSPTHEVIATAPILANAEETDSDARLGDKPPEPEKHTLKDFIHNPVSSIQAKVTGQGGHQIASNLAAIEISHGKDVELVRAKDEAKKAGVNDQENRDQVVETLTKERQDMYVRWTMDRHVSRVRILPVGREQRPSRGEYTVIDQDGNVKTDWDNWGRHV